MEDSRRRQQQTTIEAQAQQQVLFNSMLEGLLLLDRNRRIYLANRSFNGLFGLKAELRGNNLAARLGGDEFAAILPGAVSPNEASDVAATSLPAWGRPSRAALTAIRARRSGSARSWSIL